MVFVLQEDILIQFLGQYCVTKDKSTSNPRLMIGILKSLKPRTNAKRRIYPYK